VAVKQEVTPDGVIAQLQISSAEAADSGAYFCQANNLYGRDQQLVQLLVQGTTPPVSGSIRSQPFHFLPHCALYGE